MGGNIMEVLLVEPIVRTFDDTLKYLLSKGYRSEGLYDNGIFEVTLKYDHPWEYFCRKFWETNHFHANTLWYQTQYMDKDTIVLKLRLSEAIDYIYACTPSRLQSEIASNITTIKDITDLLHGFLVDDTLGRQEYYHDRFKTLTMMSFEKEPGFDTSRIYKLRELVPQDLIAHVVYQNDKTKNNGVYTFQCYNKSQLMELIALLKKHTDYSVIETYKNKEGYYHIGIEFRNGPRSELNGFSDALGEIITHSYGWKK